MINKTATHVAEAIGAAMDRATVMIGGFGTAGIPNVLINGLLAQGAKDRSVFLCSLLCSRA
jgi:3-oxoadipate CoA-transferase alpha subunit